jgi:predicted HTH domain antitoxin
MPLTISDPDLEAAGMTADEARIEIACRLYDCQRLSFGEAIRWSGLHRTGFESALLDRGLPVYRLTEEDLAQELASLNEIGD